jgi:hypothetical protein
MRIFSPAVLFGFTAVAPLLSLPTSALAAPGNDDFASAIPLSGAPVSVDGDNTGASLESGEFDPSGRGGASVWYSWTAPATGWFEVSTVSEDPSHDLDTMIVLHSAGAGPASAPVLGFNDDVMFSSQSRLVFHAAAGTGYRVAVHGYRGETGGFRLSFAQVATPAAVVSGVSFSPATVDVGTASASSTASLTVETTSPLIGMGIDLFTPQANGWIDSTSVDAADRVSGTELSGVYQASFQVAAFRSPGDYPVRANVWLGDEGFNWSSTGPDHLDDDYLIPSASTLQVENTGSVDDAAPVLTALSGMPATINLDDGEALLTLKLTISDVLAGFDYGEVSLVSDDDDYEIAYLDEWSRISGTANSGIYETEGEVGTYIPPGTYSLVVTLVDGLGNRARYGSAGGPPLPFGVPATITITATPPANDAFADRVVLDAGNLPVVSGTARFASLEAGEPDLDDSVGGSVWYEWTASASGWVGLQVSTDGEDPAIAIFTGTSVSTLSELGRNDGSLRDGAARRPLVFHAQAGLSYKIAVYAPRYDVAEVGFELELNFLPAPPALRVTGFSISPDHVDVGAGGQTVTLQVTVESDSPLLPDSSGSTWLTARLHPDGNSYGGSPVIAEFTAADRISGNTTSGTYRRNVTIPGYLPPALWHLAVTGALAGSSEYHWTAQGADPLPDAFLMPLGGGTLTVVNTGIIDTEPPGLTALGGLPATLDVSGGAVTVTLSLTISDPGAGFSTGSIWLFPNGFSGGLFGVGALTAATRVSGDANHGVHEITYDFTNAIPPGEYVLSIYLEDQSGNGRTYGPGFFSYPLPPGGNGTVVITNGSIGYAAWAETQDFGPLNLSAPDDDPNHDGVSNLLCYAFNLPPYGPPARPMIPGNNDTSGLRIEYLRRQTLGSQLTYRPQFGSRLETGVPGGFEDYEGEFEYSPVGIDWLRIIVEDPVTGADTRFGRVGVDLE